MAGGAPAVPSRLRPPITLNRMVTPVTVAVFLVLAVVSLRCLAIDFSRISESVA